MCEWVAGCRWVAGGARAGCRQDRCYAMNTLVHHFFGARGFSSDFQVSKSDVQSHREPGANSVPAAGLRFPLLPIDIGAATPDSKDS